MNFSICIDDVSPHPKSSTSVLSKCLPLIKRYPGVKFSLFVPMAYFRFGRHGTEGPLSLSKYPEFCQQLKSLDPKIFELCYHGYFHGNPAQQSSNDEFHKLGYTEARSLFDLMLSEAESCGIIKLMKPYFRPPAFRMSPEAIEAALDSGIELLALNPEERYMQTYKGAQEKISFLTYSDFCPPHSPLVKTNNHKAQVTYHACEWLDNYLSEKNVSQLIEHLDSYDDLTFSHLKEYSGY